MRDDGGFNRDEVISTNLRLTQAQAEVLVTALRRHEHTCRELYTADGDDEAEVAGGILAFVYAAREGYGC